MKKEGFNQTVNVDMDKLCDKTFVTYRKSKVYKEAIYYRWNPLNFVNKHYTRKTDHVYDSVS